MNNYVITFSNLGNFGRLGNQLFQIASTIGISRRNNSSFIFPKWEYSDFFKNRIPTGNLSSVDFYKYNERGFHYNPVTITENTDLFGYFQSEKYFIESNELIREYFEFIPSLKIEPLEDYCSVHIRRTDYLELKDYHPVQDMSYYRIAIEEMRKIGINKFIIFSDDIEWCKLNFKGEEFEFSEGFSDIEDLSKMSSCSHNIIANSSFSWWGAWLNKNPNKKIIAPSRWFGPRKGRVITKDLYCNGWKII